MNRFHIALSTRDLNATIDDYSQRLGRPPCVVAPGQYALWRTETLNFSVRVDSTADTGGLRHLGWEKADSAEFSKSTDVNGVVWEQFSAEQQAAEIHALWPAVDYRPD